MDETSLPLMLVVVPRGALSKNGVVLSRNLVLISDQGSMDKNIELANKSYKQKYLKLLDKLAFTEQSVIVFINNVSPVTNILLTSER